MPPLTKVVNYHTLPRSISTTSSVENLLNPLADGTGIPIWLVGWNMILFFHILGISMDWFKGKSTGNHRFSH